MAEWFDAWQVIPWGIGGDSKALACPKRNAERPDRTPGCYIEVDGNEPVAELRAIAGRHRKQHAKGMV